MSYTYRCSYCEKQGIGVTGIHSHICAICGEKAIYGWYTKPRCENCRYVQELNNMEPVEMPITLDQCGDGFTEFLQEKSMELKAWEKEGFAALINQCAKDIHTWARGKGFWHIPDKLFALMGSSAEVFKFVDDLVRVRKMALVTTETSEAVEGIRKPVHSSIPGFDNDTEEQADQIIRILDYCGSRGLPIGECIAAKMAKNEGRPHLHGKSF